MARIIAIANQKGSVAKPLPLLISLLHWRYGKRVLLVGLRPAGNTPADSDFGQDAGLICTRRSSSPKS